MSGISAGLFVFWVDWDLLETQRTSRPDEMALGSRLTTLKV
jgi:hypothetical protein